MQASLDISQRFRTPKVAKESKKVRLLSQVKQAKSKNSQMDLVNKHEMAEAQAKGLRKAKRQKR